MKVKINGKKVDAKLPKAFKKQWITALRSGKYLQGRGQLGNLKDGFCCLGVAGYISGIKTFPKNAGCFVSKGNYEFTDKIYTLKGVSKVPEILRGTASNNDLVSKLAEMNDSGKWSFKKIASYVEKYL